MKLRSTNVTVSIVIPCHNAEPFIGEAISSALSQTGTSTEIIVVDDGSTDGSWGVISSFADKVLAVQQRNLGGGAARNRGAAMATGQQIMFLDADDVLATSDTVHMLSQTADVSGAIAYCAWSTLRMSTDGWVPIVPAVPLVDERDLLRSWIEGWFVPTCAVLWPMGLYSSVGGWDEALRANQDGDLMMRALVKGIPLVRSASGHAYYRTYSGTRSSVSTDSSSPAGFQSRIRVLEKIYMHLEADGRSADYEVSFGRAYYNLARANTLVFPDLAKACLRRARGIGGDNIQTGTMAHRLLCSVLGLHRKERIARFLRQSTQGVRLQWGSRQHAPHVLSRETATGERKDRSSR